MVRAVFLTLDKNVPRWLFLFRWGLLLLFCKKIKKTKDLATLWNIITWFATKRKSVIYKVMLTMPNFPMRHASIAVFLHELPIFDWFCWIQLLFSPHARLLKIVHLGLLRVGVRLLRVINQDQRNYGQLPWTSTTQSRETGANTRNGR